MINRKPLICSCSSHLVWRGSYSCCRWPSGRLAQCPARSSHKYLGRWPCGRPAWERSSLLAGSPENGWGPLNLRRLGDWRAYLWPGWLSRYWRSPPAYSPGPSGLGSWIPSSPLSKILWRQSGRRSHPGGTDRPGPDSTRLDPWPAVQHHLCPWAKSWVGAVSYYLIYYRSANGAPSYSVVSSGESGMPLPSCRGTTTPTTR